MTKEKVNTNLSRVVEVCYEMLELADHGDKFRKDTGCGVVYATLRDSAYKIRQIAEQELQNHQDKKLLKKIST